MLEKKPLTISRNDDSSMLIETVSGRTVNVTDPCKEDISINDIAWALSRIPRFAGHTITEIPYNVAQHSVYVAKLAETFLCHSTDGIENADARAACISTSSADIPSLLIKCLIHDAHEAYTGDIPSPIKKIPELIETFKLIEQKLDHAILSHFSLSEVSESEKILIKYCDKLAQSIESYQFMPSRGLNWNLPKPSLILLQKFPAPLNPMDSYLSFISHYEYLSNQ